MKYLARVAPVMALALLACQPRPRLTVIVLDGEQAHVLTSRERTPLGLLQEAGIPLNPADRLLLNGRVVAPEVPLEPAARLVLQIRRAVTLEINDRPLQSAAFTVGEALSEAGISLYAADRLDPPAETPIQGAMRITYVPSREFTVSVDGTQVRIRSAAATVGEALAEAGIPLLGLDSSQPSENEALPQDGLIRVVRVREALILAQKSIPYQVHFQPSAEVELDHQEIVQAGRPGLSVTRTRVRYEDGKEVWRQAEAETLVRPPRDQVVGYGTKVVIRTTVVDGVPLQYWRAVPMFATAYSPCHSAADRCYPGTASGKPVQKGVVAFIYRWYRNMRGQPLYIPGYGYATVEDVGGGIPGKAWIDLGYSDAEFEQVANQWGRWVTVYFLTPVPSNIMYILE